MSPDTIPVDQPQDVQPPAPAAVPSEADLDAMFDRAYQGQEVEPAPDPAPEATPKPAPAAAAPAAPAPAPAPTPAPEPTPPPVQEPPPAEDPEVEAQRIIEADRALDRIKRDYQKRTGRPLEDPSRVMADVEKQRALVTLREEYPEIYRAMEALISPLARREELEDFQASLREQVQQGTLDVSQAMSITQVAARHQDVPLMQKDPTPLWAWVDELPYRKGREIETALTQGSSEEASAALDEFKAAKGIKHYSELLQGGQTPAPSAPAAAPAQPPAPAASPQPAPPNQERMAAAQAIPGAGTQAPPGPSGSSQQMTERELDRAFEAEYDRV